MATTDHKQATADCPVAPLANDISQQIVAHHLCEDREIAKRAAKDNCKRESETLAVLSDKIWADVDRATFLRAQSGQGALLQLAIAANVIESFHETCDGGEKLKRQSLGCLHSVFAFVEQMTGAKLDDGCRQYFMSGGYDPHSLIQSARDLIDAQQIAAE